MVFSDADGVLDHAGWAVASAVSGGVPFGDPVLVNGQDLLSVLCRHGRHHGAAAHHALLLRPRFQAAAGSVRSLPIAASTEGSTR